MSNNNPLYIYIQFFIGTSFSLIFQYVRFSISSITLLLYVRFFFAAGSE